MDKIVLIKFVGFSSILVCLFVLVILINKPEKNVVLKSLEPIPIYVSVEAANISKTKTDVSDKIISTLDIGDTVSVIRCVLTKDLYVYKVQLKDGTKGFISSYGQYSITRNGENAHIC